MNKEEFEEKFNISPDYTSPNSNGQTLWEYLEQQIKEAVIKELKRWLMSKSEIMPTYISRYVVENKIKELEGK